MTTEAVQHIVVAGAEGLPLAVRIETGGDRTPALLVHGFGSSGRLNWSAPGWLTTFRRAGIPTVTLDLRGHGASGAPHEPAEYRLSLLVADLRRVLAALPAVMGPVPVMDLVGYSMGGRLVGELVAGATGAPGAPGATGVSERGSVGLPRIGRAVIGGYDGRPLMEGMDDTQFAAFRQALAGGPAPEGRGRQVAGIALANPANDLAAMTALVERLRGDPSRLPARAVGLPTLVVAGDRDAITDDTLRWANDLPDGRHLVLPGRDHITAVPSAVFRSAAVDFLRR